MSRTGAIPWRRATSAALLACFGALLAGMLPAAATPSGTSIDAVYQLPCKGVCDGDDTPIQKDDNVANDVEIKVSSGSQLGLSDLRLEARAGSGPWVCIANWDGEGRTAFAARHRWATDSWPAGKPPRCPDSALYGDATPNQKITLRLTATERTTGDTQSNTFTMGLANSAQTPRWQADPIVSGEEENRPVVTLRWHANPEPDLVEYRLKRSDSSGGRCAGGCEFVISADDPEGQGCVYGGGGYACEDDYFPADGFTGTYTYTLTAYRASPTGTSCAIPGGGTCAGSAASPAKQASLRQPPPPPSEPTQTPQQQGQPRVEPARTSRPANDPNRAADLSRFAGGAVGANNPSVFVPDTFEGTLPYGSQRSLKPFLVPQNGVNKELVLRDLAGDSTTRDLGALMKPVAAALILLLAAAHMARVLRQQPPLIP